MKSNTALKRGFQLQGSFRAALHLQHKRGRSFIAALHNNIYFDRTNRAPELITKISYLLERLCSTSRALMEQLKMLAWQMEVSAEHFGQALGGIGARCTADQPHLWVFLQEQA